MEKIIAALEKIHGGKVVELVFFSLTQPIDRLDVELVADEMVEAIESAEDWITFNLPL